MGVPGAKLALVTKPEVPPAEPDGEPAPAVQGVTVDASGVAVMSTATFYEGARGLEAAGVDGPFFGTLREVQILAGLLVSSVELVRKHKPRPRAK
jgi:hypothetical protein